MVDSPGVALFSSVLALENDAPSAKKKGWSLLLFTFEKSAKKSYPEHLTKEQDQISSFLPFCFSVMIQHIES